MEMGNDAVCLNRMQYLNKGARWHDSLWWSSQQVGLHQNVVPLHRQHVHNDVISEAWNGLAWKNTEPSKSQGEVYIKNLGGGGGGILWGGYMVQNSTMNISKHQKNRSTQQADSYLHILYLGLKSEAVFTTIKISSNLNSKSDLPTEGWYLFISIFVIWFVHAYSFLATQIIDNRPSLRFTMGLRSQQDFLELVLWLQQEIGVQTRHHDTQQPGANEKQDSHNFLPMSPSGSPSYPCHPLALLPTHVTLWLSFLPMSPSGSPSYPCHSLALPLSGEGTRQSRFTMMICRVILKWTLSERCPWQETTPLLVNLY